MGMGGNNSPRTLDHDTPRKHPYALGLADVEGLTDLRSLRRWAGRAVGDVKRLQLGDDRTREQPAGAQVGVGTMQERASLSRATEQLDCLHRHEAQRKVVPL